MLVLVDELEGARHVSTDLVGSSLSSSEKRSLVSAGLAFFGVSSRSSSLDLLLGTVPR